MKYYLFVITSHRIALHHTKIGSRKFVVSGAESGIGSGSGNKSVLGGSLLRQYLISSWLESNRRAQSICIAQSSDFSDFLHENFLVIFTNPATDKLSIPTHPIKVKSISFAS